MLAGMTPVSSERARLAHWFYALSDETRLQVLDLLQDGERCVCELQAATGASQSRLSFHLKVLRDAGIVNDRRAGRWVHYSLRREVLEAVAAFVGERASGDGQWSAGGCGRGTEGVRSCG